MIEFTQAEIFEAISSIDRLIKAYRKDALIMDRADWRDEAARKVVALEKRLAELEEMYKEKTRTVYSGRSTHPKHGS